MIYIIVKLDGTIWGSSRQNIPKYIVSQQIQPTFSTPHQIIKNSMLLRQNCWINLIQPFSVYCCTVSYNFFSWVLLIELNWTHPRHFYKGYRGPNVWKVFFRGGGGQLLPKERVPNVYGANILNRKNLKLLNSSNSYNSIISWTRSRDISTLPVVLRPLAVNFAHFKHRQNHLTNFNQTWHKASFCEGNSNSFKWSVTPFEFSRGR